MLMILQRDAHNIQFNVCNVCQTLKINKFVIIWTIHTNTHNEWMEISINVFNANTKKQQLIYKNFGLKR